MISCCIIFNMDVTVTWPNTSAKIIMFLRARIDLACGHSALCLFCCFNSMMYDLWYVDENYTSSYIVVSEDDLLPVVLLFKNQALSLRRFLWLTSHAVID